jgi:hypothetical protein
LGLLHGLSLKKVLGEACGSNSGEVSGAGGAPPARLQQGGAVSSFLLLPSFFFLSSSPPTFSPLSLLYKLKCVNEWERGRVLVAGRVWGGCVRADGWDQEG